MNNIQKSRMFAGELYDPYDAELSEERKTAHEFVRQYNQTSRDGNRIEILKKLFGRVGDGITIEPPFYCDYGKHIYLGNNVYMNFGCVILDCNEVHIGDNVMFAPYVQLYGAHHPIEASTRIKGLEYASPISIGNNVWIGGGSIILPGVTIGDNSVIGAGSVVTKDVPPDVVFAGNPARLIRKIVSKA